MSEITTQRSQSAKVKHSRLANFNINEPDEYLTFAFIKRDHGTECEMVGWTKLFAEPHKREYVKGVVHRGGHKITIIDLKAMHGRGPTIMTSDACIVIFEYSEPPKRPIGIVVEGIANVINIADIKTRNQKLVGRAGV